MEKFPEGFIEDSLSPAEEKERQELEKKLREKADGYLCGRIITPKSRLHLLRFFEKSERDLDAMLESVPKP